MLSLSLMVLVWESSELVAVVIAVVAVRIFDVYLVRVVVVAGAVPEQFVSAHRMIYR